MPTVLKVLFVVFPCPQTTNINVTSRWVPAGTRDKRMFFDSKAATTFHSIPFIQFIQGQRAITAIGADRRRAHKQMCVLYFCSLSVVHGSCYSGVTAWWWMAAVSCTGLECTRGRSARFPGLWGQLPPVLAEICTGDLTERLWNLIYGPKTWRGSNDFLRAGLEM